MKGTNTLELNHSTVIEALQEWFDKRWKGDNAVLVRSIAPVQGLVPTFRITMSEPEPGDQV